MPRQPYIELLRNAAAHPLSSTGVPSGRIVTVTGLPLTVTGGPLGSSDITIGIQVSPASVTVVGIDRSISTTAPLTGGGDFSVNRTFAVNAFNGTQAGVVPNTSGNDVTKVLNGQGGWSAQGFFGVNSISAISPLLAAPVTGDVWLNILPVSIATPGVAPATGGADGTKFLCATNPVSWAVPGALAGAIRLQASSPGTQDIGHGNISGTFIAKSLMAGSGAANGFGSIQYANGANAFMIASSLSGECIEVIQYSDDSSGSPKLEFKRTKGTLAAPTATTAGMALGGVYWHGKGSSASLPTASIEVEADGAPAAYQPTKLFIAAGSPTGRYAQLTLSEAGALFTGGTTSHSSLAKSGVDISNSFGLLTEVKTSDFAVSNFGCHYLLNATAGYFTATLPTAVGCTGRIYKFTKIDQTSDQSFTIAPQAGQTIAGRASISLFTFGESITLCSDNANWWIVGDYRSPEKFIQVSNFAAVHTSAVEETLGQVSALTNFPPTAGQVDWAKFAGKYSTTGSPSFRFRIKNAADAIVADSGILVAGTGVTDASWQISFRSYVIAATGAGVVTDSRVLEALLHYTDQTGITKTYSMLSNYGHPTSGAIPAYITVQWGTSSASNTIQCTAAQNGTADRAGSA